MILRQLLLADFFVTTVLKVCCHNDASTAILSIGKELRALQIFKSGTDI